MSEKTQKTQKPVLVTNEVIQEGATLSDDVVIRDSRKVRGSDSWFWSNEKPASETLIKTDYGDEWKSADGKPSARFKVFENELFNVTFEMRFGGETVKRVLEHAFGRLVVLAQAKERKRVGEIGDESYGKKLAETAGVLTFDVATAFEPASRRTTDSEKAVAAIDKMNDEEELKRIELALAAAKQRIKNRRVGVGSA